MEQLVQNLKDGKMELAEVPFPALNQGCILVRNHYSLISAGTEGKTVKDARAGYIGKAKSRKDEVKKVINTARTTGIMNTYKLVMNKLEAPSPLGYCCAGEVIEVAPDITDIRIGDMVACGGNTSNHAEVIAVSRNLCVKIPDNVSPETASITTLGAVALQGIRQADLRLGENCVVIGLGLLGQLTMQMLEASGVNTIGVDIDINQVIAAGKNGLSVYNRNDESIAGIIENFTNGFGTDAVIITAGTSSSDPVNFAGEICRQKGRVIIVGAVSTDFKRNHFFKKELDLRMSCSYGPGRYDSDYEEKGIDYPIGYVRWTENRNMMAFMDLAAAGKIHPDKLITHRFGFSESIKAYDLITEKYETFLGIVLKYDTSKKLSRSVINKTVNKLTDKSTEPVVGLIGAGSFARNILLPAVKGSAVIYAVATTKPHDAKYVADKYNASHLFGNADEIFNDSKVNTVLIATRHDSHFNYVMKGLESGKNIFVEKPLCLTEDELELIKRSYANSSGRLLVGFNRRFSPLITSLKTSLSSSGDLPVSINYRINSGVVPPTHWVHDNAIGGGRIVGEVCHFIDLTTFITGSQVASVSAVTMNDNNSKNDTVAVNLYFSNGSIANISYFSNGNNSVRKELIEVFFSGNIAVIDDFSSLKIAGSKPSVQKASGQSKGHNEEIIDFLNSIKNGTPSPITFDEIHHSMLVTFKVLESLKMKGTRIFIDNNSGNQ